MLQQPAKGRVMKPDQQRVSDVVMQTVIKLCASGLEGTRTRVQGVIGVTVDDNDVFVIHINDTVNNLSAVSMAQSHTNVSEDMSPVPASLSVAAMSVTPSSARKRARHRLVFQSPDVSSHIRNDIVGEVACLERHTGVVKQSCSEAGYSSVEGSLSQLAPLNKTEYADDLKQLTRLVDQASSAAKSSVVVVDSDDEDVKLVTDDQNMPPVMSSKPAQCDESMMNDAEKQNFVDAGSTADPTTNTVSSLCIADVVGNVNGWSLLPDTSMPQTDETSPTVLKDDPDWCPDDDDVKVMEEDEEFETTQPYPKTTPPRQFQVTYLLYIVTCSVFISSDLLSLLLLSVAYYSLLQIA